MRTPVHNIIDLFGGLTALSRALGHEHPTTVQGWKKRGVIPSRQIPRVIAAAKKRGKKLSAADFFKDVAA